ncbi:MAG: hypothetical protein HY319_29160 [Armatimonadetes bacterium]|nr:hypothetical protein [Armatimonadota bacterium]
MAELEQYLGELSAGGTLHSDGHFTLDPRVALEKLQKFRLDDPRKCVCNLLASAVISGAGSVQFRPHLNGWTLSHDGRAPVRDELGELFGYLLSADSSHRALRELALGVCGALQLEGTVELATRDATLLLRGDGSSAWGPGRSHPLHGLEVRLRYGYPKMLARLRQRVGSEEELLVQFGAFAPLQLLIGDLLVRAPAAARRLAFRRLEHPEFATSSWHQPALFEDAVSSPGAFSACLRFVDPLDAGAGTLGVVSDGVHFSPARYGLGYRCGHALVWCSGLERDLTSLSLVENERLEALRVELASAFDDLAIAIVGQPELWAADPRTAYPVLVDLVERYRHAGRQEEAADLALLETVDRKLVSLRTLEDPALWTRSETRSMSRTMLRGDDELRRELLKALAPEAQEMVVSPSDLVAPRYLSDGPPRLLGSDYLVRVAVEDGELGFRGPPPEGARLTLYSERELVYDQLSSGDRDLALAFPHGCEAVLELSPARLPTDGLARLCRELAANFPRDGLEREWAMGILTECLATACRMYCYHKGKLGNLAGRMNLSVPPYVLMLTGRTDSEACFFKQRIAQVLALDELADHPLVFTRDGKPVTLRQLGEHEGPWYYGVEPTALVLSARTLGILRLFLGFGKFVASP